MPLETGTYISDLVETNPAHTDGLAQADSHLRLIKSAVKATFPNINGVVNASDEDLNNLQGQLTSGVSVLKDTGVFFDTNHFDGFTNPAEGLVAITATDTAGTASAPVATFNGNTLKTSLAGALEVVGNVAADGNATVTGTLAVTGPLSAPGITPIGAMLMWLSDTLPNSGGVWAWANGQALSRTTAGAGLELYTEWSRNSGNPLRYGAGDGSTTFNVINMQEVAPVGKSTMGGGTSPGLLASIASGIKTALGSIFGHDTNTMQRSDLPNVDVTVTIHDPEHDHGLVLNTGAASGGPNIAFSVGGGQVENLTTLSSATGITADFQLNGAVTQTAQGNTQPSGIVNFIIRIA